MDGSYWKDLLRPTYEGKRWLLAIDAAAAAGSFVELLEEYGAQRGLVLAGSEGTGELLDPEKVEVIVLGVRGHSMLGGIRAFHAALADLPDDVQARIDAWDPDGSARVLAPFLPSSETVAGRPLYGAREPEWQALEDKVAIEPVWDAAGVRRAPSEIVPIDRAALLAAHDRLDQGHGTAWVGDNRDGWHGGAEMLRWVRTPEDADEALEHLGSQCDVARVMPFLDGLPCSIHAVIFPDHTAVFRPVEMIVLRARGRNRLQYGGVATFWDAPPAAADYMRDVARRTAAHLQRTVGYRGTFGIDGVLTADGFFPTELNARYSGGLYLQTSTVEDLPMGTLNLALIAGEDYDFRGAELEAMVEEASEKDRRAHIVLPAPGHQPSGTEKQEIVFGDGAARPAADGEQAHGALRFGPAAMGGIVLCSLDKDHTPIGPPVASRAIPAIQLAADLWGIELGDLEPAPEPPL